jgi:hypothetical protein
VDIFHLKVFENVIQLILVRIGEEKTSGLTVDLVEMLASLSDNRCVDKREYFGDVLLDKRIEKHFVRILKRAQIDMLGKRARLFLKRFVGSGKLQAKAFLIGRNQSVKP